MSNVESPVGPYGDDPKATAKAAKAYAKAQRPWFKKKRFILPLAFVLIAVISQAAGGSSDETPPAAADTSTTGDAAAGEQPNDSGSGAAAPAVEVTAKALLKEFEDNELAGDQKYKGKVLKITGTVSGIDTEIFDDEKYVLNINGGGDFEILSVSCYDIPNADLSSVTVGQTITVVGDFDDGGDLGVDVKNCTIA